MWHIADEKNWGRCLSLGYTSWHIVVKCTNTVTWGISSRPHCASTGYQPGALNDWGTEETQQKSAVPCHLCQLTVGFLFQGAPKPIAIEPCAGNRAAVLTVFLCLPRGSSGAPPPGQSGMTHEPTGVMQTWLRRRNSCAKDAVRPLPSFWFRMR